MDFDYDQEADVLYVTLKEHTKADCTYVETPDEAVIRVGPDGEPVGLTIPFFLARYVQRDYLEQNI